MMLNFLKYNNFEGRRNANYIFKFFTARICLRLTSGRIEKHFPCVWACEQKTLPKLSTGSSSLRFTIKGDFRVHIFFSKTIH